MTTRLEGYRNSDFADERKCVHATSSTRGIQDE